MGLLNKLFDKKICAICGGEIGLLGNRKLEDGNLCKDCAKKLSPFLTDRRRTTVEEIRQHLAYREQNQRVLLAMTPTKAFGHGYTKVYVDENQGTFIVTRDSNYMAHNPDVFSVSQVIGIRPSIHENRTELYHHDREGRSVPYTPRRYRVEYRFDMAIDLNTPFCNRIEFEVSSDRPDSPIIPLYRELEAECVDMQNYLNPDNYASFAPTAMVAGSAPAAAEASRPQTGAAKPRRGAQPAPIAVEPALDPGQWKCECGSVNGGKFCTNCGAKKPVIYRCDKCGWMPADIENLPKFCPNCGDPFNEEDMV